MPADDLVLNVRQISGYTATLPQQGDNLLLQRGGIGGPYLSVSAQDLVATALAGGGGPLQVGMGLPTDAAPGHIAAANGVIMGLNVAAAWNSYFSINLNEWLRVGPGEAGAFGYNPDGGFHWDEATVPGGADSAVQFTSVMSLDATGYLTVNNQVLLARDPAGPLEAATAQWVENVIAGVRAASVWSFMGRTGDVRLWIQDILAAGGAPQFSPVFGGQPLAPTPDLRSCNSRIATTAFVHQAIVCYLSNFLTDQPFVSSFNGRTGAIVLTSADIVAAAPPYAPLLSPEFSGVPEGPTAPTGTSTGQLATTAFVMNAVADSVTGVASFNTRTGAVTLQATDLTAAGGALLLSPNFSGTPQAPTATPGTNTGQLATCAFVQASLAGAGVTSFNTRSGAVTFTAADLASVNGATQAYVNSAVAAAVVSFNGRTGAVQFTASDLSAVGGAPLNSPAFVNVPTAPTAAPGVSTTQLATTAFVMAAVAAVAGVVSFNGRAGAVTLLASDLGASVGGPFLPLAGGQLTGNLSLSPGALTAAGAIAGGSLSSGTTLLVSGSATIGGATTVGSLNVTPGAIAAGAVNCANLTASGNVTANQVYAGSTGVTDFFLSAATDGSTRALNMAGGAFAFTLTIGGATSGTMSWIGNTANLMHIDISGNMGIAGTLSQGSDADTKDDIVDYRGGLADLLQLRPRQYARKNSGRREIGFVHQEARPVREEFAPISGMGLKGIDPVALLACAVSAIKELSAKLDALTAKVEAMA